MLLNSPLCQSSVYRLFLISCLPPPTPHPPSPREGLAKPSSFAPSHLSRPSFDTSRIFCPLSHLPLEEVTPFFTLSRLLLEP